MSSTREDYQPPYEPAEIVFMTTPPLEFKDRFFMCSDLENGGYWLPREGVPSGADGYSSDRNKGGVWAYHHCKNWAEPSVNRTLEMLPLPITMPSAPNEADRSIAFAELPKVSQKRICVIKNKEGQYLDKEFKPVAERPLAQVFKAQGAFALTTAEQEFTYELLVPVDANTGGHLVESEVCFAESQRHEDNRRFMVRRAKANETNGYAYYDGGPSHAVRRSLAAVLGKKELRKRFDDVPKTEIVIELLKPMPLSKMEDFFNASAMQLIKASPKNEMLRGFMLSKLKVMPPAEADTYEKLEQWIIWNVSSPAGRKAQ